ncbi:pseudaminic acid biosynthesis-associated methylase [Thermodesulfovibrio sp.]|uniref:pseudaminic acid biosynthesis-associated methylase n=1 Tax=Thermodesulfovibrio sp. TaxID=2067987 RepID=UPI003096E52D
MNKTPQIDEWSGDFGLEYTKRNSFSLKKFDNSYREKYGLTRTELNRRFLDDLNRGIKILEVGSNIGIQLALLQKMGFENLYGIEINKYAVQLSKKFTKDINIIWGSAFDIPFKDGYFDLVFTSGVLIHIHPSDIKIVMEEIYRCSKKYIWGFEYYSEDYTEIEYRGHKNLLWKANFPKLYTEFFKDLKLVKIEFIKYLHDSNIDVMFLLEKNHKVEVAK